MIHSLVVEVVSVVSLESSDGWQSFLRETGHPVAVAQTLWSERERADALSVSSDFAVWS